jgi:class 3 adenylate cyclase/tetratricopeptide (TPR) repeat protein
VICPSCGAENRPDGKFCFQCGGALAAPCAACGTTVRPGARFCDECGTPVGGAPPSRSQITATPESERRLVSVLFADLVGFTTLSEARDAEEVRDLLSRYFEAGRTLITRYGGAVEKFIGDAVMAVWGTPVAREDDAERAVRAALDLVASVAVLGEEVGAADLRARAGVLTGEAAVTLGAEGQGMVAGDLVNTASRIQAAAAPGQVYVGETTRRATDAAIAYRDAGSHELKGKAEAVPLWEAMRVVAGRRGALRSEGLEAPFVGRDRELALAKDRFHATVEDDKAQRVSVIGIAGIGKSRLSWELYKYLDGLAQTVLWHRGRCLPYGDGVTYWALAEMVRMRAGIAEGEEAASAAEKLRACVEEHVADPEERRWVLPRLAHLLSLEDRAAGSREDLFAGWRLFFERVAERNPTVLVFEDCQWADAALVDFVDYLLDWSRDSRLLVLTLARPDVADRHPALVAARRAGTSIYLEPLPRSSMEALLAGLVPGLPDALRERILDRAEGIPLYAVETVRMLLDRGLVERDGDRFTVTGPVDVLEVPETLHALIAARLDGLPAEERRVLQNAAVAGKTFGADAVVALAGITRPEADALLASLVRKELLSVQTDPRSPERGQYVFLQALVRRVAYETQSLRERKRLHLSLAEYLETSWAAEDEEVVEIVASHLLDAYRAGPDAEDAPAIRARARECLVRAGHRAASLAATEDAQRYFERAAELTDEPRASAELLERAGRMAEAGGRVTAAREHFETALSLFEAEGATHAAARVSAGLAEIDWDTGHIERGVERMENAFAVLRADPPDEDLATLAAQLGRMHFFAGELDTGAERLEFALNVAERLWLPDTLSHALNTKSLVLAARGRYEEAVALLQHALSLALEHDLGHAAFRAYYNLALEEEAQEGLNHARNGLALARRLGDRAWEMNFIGRLASVHWLLGEWDEALEEERTLTGAEASPSVGLALSRAMPSLVHLHVNRGDVEGAERLLALRADARSSLGIVERADYLAGLAMVERARGNLDESLRVGLEIVEIAKRMGTYHETVREGCPEAIEAAFALGELSRVQELLDLLTDLANPHAYIRRHLDRLAARLAAVQGRDAEAEAGYAGLIPRLRPYGAPFLLALALCEYGEWLAGRGREDDARPLLAEAGEIFERLKAQPWLDRLARLGPGRSAPEPVASGTT